MPSYQLDYFPVRGRGEFIRLLFALGKTPFSERSITMEEWRAGEKQKTPFGCCPVLVLDGGRASIGQHLAIGRYLGATFGLEAATAEEKATSECWADHANDLYKTFFPIVLNRIIMPNPEKAAVAIKEFVEGDWSAFCHRFQKAIHGKKWINGDKLTWVDAYVAEFVDKVARITPAGVVADCDDVFAFKDRFYALPEVSAYCHSPERKVGLEGKDMYN